jgi:YVTN family beta-propeller protein
MSATKAGARPPSEDFTNYSDGTPIVVDRKDAFAITGTVSVVDLEAGKEVKAIKVGLHPAGMTISGSDLYVANAYSDSLSVIDLNTGSVTRTIDLSVPIAGGVFGSGPNGVAVTDDGGPSSPWAKPMPLPSSTFRDGMPSGHRLYSDRLFPDLHAYDKARKQLVVADDKGLGTHVP